MHYHRETKQSSKKIFFLGGESIKPYDAGKIIQVRYHLIAEYSTLAPKTKLRRE